MLCASGAPPAASCTCACACDPRRRARARGGHAWRQENPTRERQRGWRGAERRAPQRHDLIRGESVQAEISV
jgi:hypothetical protein